MISYRRIATLSCVLAICLSAGQAKAGVATPGITSPPADFFLGSPTLINFDVDASGAAIPTWTDVDSQYATLGVVFSIAPNSPASSCLQAGTAGQDYVTPPNALWAAHTEYATDNTGLTIIIDFVESHFADGLPTAAGLVFTDSGHENPFTLRAYDSAGVEVDSVTIDTADEEWNSTDQTEDTFCGVRGASGISRLEYSTPYMLTGGGIFGGGIYGVEIDNLYFGECNPLNDGCPAAPDPSDRDGDGVPDAVDGCPDDPSKTEPGSCGCGVPDADTDGDGVPDCVDNCRGIPNADQADTNADGLGDACTFSSAGCGTGSCGVAGGLGGLMPFALTLLRRRPAGWPSRSRSREVMLARTGQRLLPKNLGWQGRATIKNDPSSTPESGNRGGNG